MRGQSWPPSSTATRARYNCLPRYFKTNFLKSSMKSSTPTAETSCLQPNLRSIRFRSGKDIGPSRGHLENVQNHHARIRRFPGRNGSMFHVDLSDAAAPTPCPSPVGLGAHPGIKIHDPRVHPPARSPPPWRRTRVASRHQFGEGCAVAKLDWEE